MSDQSKKLLAAAIVLGVAGLATFAAISGILVDRLWFGELGYADVFRTIWSVRLVVFLVGFVASAAVLVPVGLWAVARSGTPRVVFRVVRADEGNGGFATFPELLAPVSHRIPWRALVVGVAMLIAAVLGVRAQADWDTFYRWWHQVPYGLDDPLFSMDIGHYLFRMPAARSAVGLLRGGIVAVAGLMGVVFWLRGSLDLRRSDSPITPELLRAICFVAAAWCLVKVGGDLLSRYELAFDAEGAVFGAGYAAATSRLFMRSGLVVGSIAAVGCCLWAARTPSWRPLGLAAGLLAVTTVLEITYPAIVQRFIVRPNELSLERPFLERNLAMTREAYGLDDIQSQPFLGTGKLDRAAIERNAETLENIRLWDPLPILDALRQLQVIRLYYDFHDIDVDRYVIDGKLRQVMVSARELDPAQIPEAARTWVNKTLKYTHGIGAVVSPVTEFDGEGLPRLWVKDIPPKSSIGIELDQPRVYFGERASTAVIVGAQEDEFDYPKGAENVSTRYTGTGGISIGSLGRRLLFSWALGDLNLLISSNLGDESRVLIRRRIRERIHRLAPFLRLDRDPYVVLAGGRLQWVQDAYTTSESFPYSQPVSSLGINYIRNSVKIVVDAYDGTTTFYVVDDDEPILATYRNMFPELFRDIDTMSEELRAHLRYPEDLFLVQAEIYRTYHMTSPEVFYNREDLWNFAKEQVNGVETTVRPYYVIMRLPGEERSEFVLMLPMTPANRDNMVAWLAARSDPPHDGELVEFLFSKDSLVYGPSQIEARIDQDTVISQQISLWNQMGSLVIRGNLLVIPIEDSLLYVEPLYLRSEQGQIPELKRVIVAYHDRIAMDETLEGALASVLRLDELEAAAEALLPPGTPRSDSSVVVGATGSSDLRKARNFYRRALDRLREGDWEAFGRDMSALGDALEAEAETADPPLPDPGMIE